MSDSEVKGEAPKPKITSDVKEKNPGRVAAGKKLAAMNRARLARSVGTVGTTQHTTPEPYSDNEDCGAETGWSSPMVILSVVGVATGIACLYYTYKQDKRSDRVLRRGASPTNETNPTPQPSSAPSGALRTFGSPSAPSGGNLKSFD